MRLSLLERHEDFRREKQQRDAAHGRPYAIISKHESSATRAPAADAQYFRRRQQLMLAPRNRRGIAKQRSKIHAASHYIEYLLSRDMTTRAAEYHIAATPSTADEVARDVTPGFRRVLLRPRHGHGTPGALTPRDSPPQGAEPLRQRNDAAGISANYACSTGDKLPCHGHYRHGRRR